MAWKGVSPNRRPGVCNLVSGAGENPPGVVAASRYLEMTADLRWRGSPSGVAKEIPLGVHHPVAGGCHSVEQRIVASRCRIAQIASAIKGGIEVLHLVMADSKSNPCIEMAELLGNETARCNAANKPP